MSTVKGRSSSLSWELDEETRGSGGSAAFFDSGSVPGASNLQVGSAGRTAWAATAALGVTANSAASSLALAPASVTEPSATEPGSAVKASLESPSYGATGLKSLDNVDGVNTPAFNIVFNYTDGDTSYAAIADAAAAYWELIITQDVPDFGGVDDLRIDSHLGLIGRASDGQGGVLANAGARLIRPGSNIPYTGEMGIDPPDVTNVGLKAIIAHEIGHVLRLVVSGTGFVTEQGGQTLWTGANAVAEYRILSNNSGATTILMQSGGGHWDETTFGRELMTPLIDTSQLAPLSRMSIAALRDIGYTVDLGYSDPFFLPSTPTQFRDDFSGNYNTTQTLVLGANQNGTIELTEDNDWFVVNLSAGTTYTFEMLGGTLSDSILALRALDGEILSVNNGAGANSTIVFTASANAQYYVDASAFGNLTGTYTVRYYTGSGADDYADSFGDLTSPFGNVAPGGTATGNIEINGDHDWFAVQLVAGVTYTIDLEGSETGVGTLFDPLMGLYNSVGNLVSSDDDNGEGRNSRIVYTVTVGGTFYIEAGAYNDGYSGTYRISISGVPSLFTEGDDDVTLPSSDGTWYALGGNDRVIGTEGTDTIYGEAGGDRLYGMGGNDTLVGGSDGDILDGGAGNDTLIGGLNDDLYIVDSGDTIIENDGDSAFDRARASSSFTLAAGVSIEYLETANQSSTTPISLEGNEFGQLITGNSGANRLYGQGGIDTIYGYDGNDTLDGGTGNDTLYGGAGDDIYVVNQGDTIVEYAGYGTDRARVAASFSLANGVSIEFLETVNPNATTAISLEGNDFGQTIIGNNGVNVLYGRGGVDVLYGHDGNDTLDGGAGNDTMYGGTGNDIFIVNQGDTLIDYAGAGTDRAQAAASFTLANGVYIEVVETTNVAGTTAISLAGNDFANSVYGNNGVNSLYGFGGNDILNGYNGNDTLNGGAGNDTLYGGNGNDTLTGGADSDIFVFNTTLNAATNRDTITDFSVPLDTIHLENAAFTKLAATGVLNSAFFRVGPAALDANDYIVYNSATGALSYDSDGNGAGAAIQFATLSTGLALTNADFIVI